MKQQEINTKDLLGIDLGFENCDGMFIPSEALTIHKIDNGELDVYINLNSEIKYGGCYKDLTPLQRINELNDITFLNLIYQDKDLEYRLIKYGNGWEQENRFQSSELESWNKLHLEISKDVLKREIQSMKDQATQLLQQAEELELSIS
ncbi:MAG: hypothetical protein ACRC1T_05040 [Clostridium chrysemydis]|uniref:hypothetical protein n=1 Tax=Clostridium chrysemydis TaxID=2665504 RepID=UPI003F404C5F